MEKEMPKYHAEPVCREYRYRGRLLVRLSLGMPVLEGKAVINAFYEKMAENLMTYAQKLAEEREALLQGEKRELRRAMRETILRFMPRVTYLDERYFSVLWEIFRAEKGSRPAVHRIAQTFSVEREILLPPTYFLGKRDKHPKDAPYYLTEEGVIFF